MYSGLACNEGQSLISIYNDPEQGCPTYMGACCGDGGCKSGIENLTNCPSDCPA